MSIHSTGKKMEDIVKVWVFKGYYVKTIKLPLSRGKEFQVTYNNNAHI